MEREFDVVVIGAGPAGEVLAGRLSERGGKRVAIVERGLVGGECSFYACMPSKALLRPAEVLREVARVPGAAQAVTGELDVAAVLARRDSIVNHLDDDNQVPWLQARDIELVRGHGRLDGERRVRVGDDVLVARDAVVIAVGTGALMPPIPGLAAAGAWSNREITTAREVPGRLLVLGGGVVGVEMAQAWASLGSRVTVIEAEQRLLPREEPLAGDELQAALERLGVPVRIGVRATEVARDGGEITVSLENGERVTGERLLVAIGRRPLTADLGLETVGLPGGYIEVDDQLRVPDHPWLYAIGDVNGRSLLTHSGKYQARIAADHILGDDAAAYGDGPGAPRVIFTDPQVAAVGLTLADAMEAGIPAEAIDLPTSGTAGASLLRPRRAQHDALRRRYRARRPRRRHVRRAGGRRAAARRHDRRRRRGPSRRARPRRAVVPDAQRAVAEVPRGLRARAHGHAARHAAARGGGVIAGGRDAVPVAGFRLRGRAMPSAASSSAP